MLNGLCALSQGVGTTTAVACVYKIPARYLAFYRNALALVISPIICKNSKYLYFPSSIPQTLNKI